MLSLIFLGLCIASGLAGACILVLTWIEIGESDCESVERNGVKGL